MDNSSVRKGLSVCDVLTIIFIVLKVLGYIDWPWIWVLSPIWISLGLVIAILILIAVITFIIEKIRGYR